MQSYKEVPNFKDLQYFKPHLKALFWDMDGTICNTETLHAKALVDLLQSHGLKMNEQLNHIVEGSIGLADEMVLVNLNKLGYLKTLSVREFLDKKNSFFLRILSECNSSDIMDKNIQRLFLEIKQLQIPMTLVTSSEVEITTVILRKLELAKFFKFIITRKDTKENKPHPAPYLLALERNQLTSSDALIIEDSDIGIAAAKAAEISWVQAKWY